MSNNNNNNGTPNLNSIPAFLFTPFKRSREYFFLVNTLSSIAIIICGFKVDFTASNLESLAKLTLSTVFVIGALGLNIFKMDLDKINDQSAEQQSDVNNPIAIQPQEVKTKLIYSYIGVIFLCSSIAILGFILSLLDLNPTINKIYSIVALILIVRMLTSTLASLVAYYNVRD